MTSIRYTAVQTLPGIAAMFPGTLHAGHRLPRLIKSKSSC
jgi:hypothetical protein